MGKRGGFNQKVTDNSSDAAPVAGKGLHQLRGGMVGGSCSAPTTSMLARIATPESVPKSHAPVPMAPSLCRPSVPAHAGKGHSGKSGLRV